MAVRRSGRLLRAVPGGGALPGDLRRRNVGGCRRGRPAHAHRSTAAGRPFAGRRLLARRTALTTLSPSEGVRPDSASHSPLRWLVLALLAIGVALRVWQYLGDMSLWFDELSIARNVYERTLGELMTEPLGYDQIAPLGFLAMVKGSALLAGPTDLALRLFPFLCGLLSLVLFWRVAERVLHGIAVPFAVALFALGLPFIRYSAELKQYGPDVAVTLALTWIALDLRAAPQSVRRCIMAGLAGF